VSYGWQASRRWTAQTGSRCSPVLGAESLPSSRSTRSARSWLHLDDARSLGLEGDRDPRDLTNEFRIAAFDDVQDDPEFLQAISRQ
jgi:hypothetical protein